VSSENVVGALDIGGTHVSAGRVDLATGSVEAHTRLRVPLPSAGTRAELLAAIARAAVSIAGPALGRLGVAVPGPFDYSSGVSKTAHKLRGLHGVDLRSELCRVLGFTDPRAVRFLNDADAFLLGEWLAGAARGHARAVGVTLGTGLGSAFIEDGRIAHTGRGVPSGGALWELPFRGAPVEQTISSSALLARWDAPLRERMDVEGLAGRARAGDGSACRVFEELGQALGEFLAPSLAGFGASCLVVGGSIAHSWELFEPRLRAELEPVETLETVTVAEQLDDAPLLGAAWCIASVRG
jgi:glucokinase